MEKLYEQSPDCASNAPRPAADAGNAGNKESRKLEEALRKSEAELKEAQRLARIGSWDWDADTDTIRWSDEYYRIYSLDPDLPTPKYDEHLKAYTAESRARLDAAVQKSLQTGEPYELDLELANPSSSTRWVCARGEAKRNAGGRITGLRGTAQDITGRRLAEEAIRENEQKYRTLIETTNTGFVIVDDRGTVLDANQEYVRMTGRDSLGEIQGRNISEWTADWDRERNGQEVTKCLEQGFVRNLEVSYVNKDGRVTPVEINATVIRDAGGLKILSVCRDITERKRAETALKDREKQLAESQRLARIGSWERNLVTNKVTWSEEHSRILGLDPDKTEPGLEILMRMIHPDDRERLRLAVKEAISENKPYDIDYRIIRGDGTEAVLHASAEVIYDGEGKPLLFRGTTQDITERKRAEMQLRERETFLKNVLETVDEGFIVVDRNYTVLSANRAYLERLNKPLDEVIGKPCYTLTHHVGRHCKDLGERCAVHETFETGKPSFALHTHSAASGEPEYVEIKSYPVFDPAGNVISAIETITDISGKKRLEEQLRHAQKMEAIGTLAGGIAHDFNNILSAIIGYGSLVQMKMNADDPVRLNVDHILDAANRAAQLTQGLLTFSRKQVITVQPLRLNDIIARVEKLLVRIIGEDISLVVKLPEGELDILADSSQIEQVLMNLATNARDAMPAGGRLQVDVEATHIDAEYIRIHGFGKTGPYALISVTDTGSGMDQATIEKIFEPFFTTKEIGKGTGLGLSIVYGIVKQHNGFINVYSEPGKGSTFKIYLPLIGRAEIRTMGPSPSEHPMGGTETLLIAEDDDTLRNLMCTVLKEFGYTVIEARNGEEAVENFKQNRDRVRLVILDVVMPGLSGKDAYAAISGIKPDAKIIFQSGYPADLMHRKGLPDSADHFLNKPVSPRILLQKVRKVLDS